MIIIPPSMINKDFAAMKATLIFHQEFSIRFRKRFERCKKNKDDNRLLLSIARTIEIAETIRVAKAIRTSELRMIIARI